MRVPLDIMKTTEWLPWCHQAQALKSPQYIFREALQGRAEYPPIIGQAEVYVAGVWWKPPWCLIGPRDAEQPEVGSPCFALQP